MVNFNGDLLDKDNCLLSVNNRGFKYGDSLFETIRIEGNRIVFLEDHYFRLMASMRMLRMQIPMSFTLDYLEGQIISLLQHLADEKISRIRCTVFRKEGGFYKPNSNEVDFLIEAFDGIILKKETYTVDLYKDHYVSAGLFSTIKSSNRLLNVLSSIYADENDLDNCILLNEQKNVVEASNSNIFMVNGHSIRTPKLLDGCIKGILRSKMIQMIEKHPIYTIQETSISPFEIQKADEVFLTNAIIGVQPVTNYRKKKFSVKIANELANELALLAV